MTKAGLRTQSKKLTSNQKETERLQLRYSHRKTREKKGNRQIKIILLNYYPCWQTLRSDLIMVSLIYIRKDISGTLLRNAGIALGNCRHWLSPRGTELLQIRCSARRRGWPVHDGDAQKEAWRWLGATCSAPWHLKAQSCHLSVTWTQLSTFPSTQKSGKVRTGVKN